MGTVSDNLSNPDRINLNVSIETTSLNNPERTGVYYVTGNNIGALPSGFSNYGILLCMRSPYSLHPTNSNCVYVQEYTDVYGKHASRSFNNGVWTNWTTTATKDDLTPAFTKVGSGYGLEVYHAAIGKLHILRLAGNVTSAFSNLNLALPDSCDGYFISEPGKVGDISYTIEINSKHLIVTPSTSVPVGKYFVHWLIYYGY